MASEHQEEPKPAVQLWLTPQPPFPKGPYSPEKALRPDVACVTYALHLFIASHMHESEAYCRKYDPKM